MIRYVIFSETLSLNDVEQELKRVGAKNIRSAQLLGQSFAELDPEQVKALSKIPGFHVKEVKKFTVDQIIVSPLANQAVVEPTFLKPPFDSFSQLRDGFVPALTGVGLTIAVLDSGIRKTHEGLVDKVIYEANFTDAPDTNDVFGHGTKVAFVAAGGIHGTGINGVSPGAKLMNVKVMGDDGIGTDETVVMGIEDVCRLVDEAKQNELHPTDELYPNILNLSLGSEDTGDPDDPICLACRQASVNYGLDVIASAGNMGPKPTTILVPAAEPEVIAVGGLVTPMLELWEQSSRGPTLLGATKPDFVLWATDVETAGHRSDDEYVAISGTSFAAPMLGGLGGLIGEALHRAYGYDYSFRWSEFRGFAPLFCIKPEGAPIRMDNDYGYGLPAIGTILSRVSVKAMPMQDMLSVTMLVMMMGMIMKVMG